MTEDDFNAMAWAAFVQWAVAQSEMRTLFTKETGLTLPTPCSFDDVAAFVDWVTVNHWGIKYAPKKFREEWEARQR